VGIVFVFKVKIVIIRRGIFPFFLMRKNRQLSDWINFNANLTVNGNELGD
jgi:hypothetical protein